MKYTHENYSKIVTDESLRETIPHGSDDYPFRYYLEDIWEFDFHCIDWHWHPEVEFVLIEKGTMELLVGSDRYTVEAGTGIFINSQVIHRCRTDFADIQNKKECGGNRQWQNHYLRNWAANTKGKGII